MTCKKILPESQPRGLVVELLDFPGLALMQESDSLAPFLQKLLGLLVHLLLQERFAHTHALFQLHALPAPLLVASQL